MSVVLRFVIILTAAGLVGAQAGRSPAVTVLEPTPETFLVGPTRLRAAIVPEEPAPVSVVFHVDGVEVCRIVEAPYACQWDAGSRVAERVVRVVATFGDGRRSVAAVRTRQVRVSETHVESVVVSTHVTDESGRFVPGLTAPDFAILEDGVPQAVQLLGAGEIPAEVLLALDVSRSMEPEIEDLKVAVREFAASLPDTAHVAVGAFNSNLFLMSPFESDARSRLAGLDRLRAWGTTAIHDTMIRAVDLLRDRGARRALVLFTDGEDVSSRASLDSARIALQSHDVLLYIVASGRAAADRSLRTQLADLARETGGAAYFAARLSGTADHFRDIATDMANQYLLAFAPTRPLGDGRWRDLTVRVGDPRYQVRARTGYFARRHTGGGR
jgi:Ca-activated chloride channel family protein